MNFTIYPGRGTSADWENPSLLAMGRLPAQADFVPFPDGVSCREAESDHGRYTSPSVFSLRGEWDFRFYPSILQLPENILSFRSGFSKRLVPETEPIEFNFPTCVLPFPDDPPAISGEQPVLVYRKSCQLPILWNRLRKHLVLNGVRTACHIFVNGKPAGFSQGSRLTARFDLTSLMHDGTNEIFIICYPYAGGSYLEKQPQKAWFGLVGDVYLEAVPALTIGDFHIRTRWLAQDKTWALDLSCLLLSYRIALDQPVVRVSLRENGQIIHQTAWSVSMQADAAMAPLKSAGKLERTLHLPDIKPWSDEAPNLYDLELTVDDRRGQDMIFLNHRIGFRQIERQEQMLLVNGRAVRLNVLRWSSLEQPDLSLDLGFLVSRLKFYKQNHINAIWFCSEPPDPIVLELCDIYGFYVILDTPFYWHDSWAAQLNKRKDGLVEQWIEDRLTRLIKRDRSRCSVIAWSAPFFLQDRTADPLLSAAVNRAVELIEKLDDTRLIHGVSLPRLDRRLVEFSARAGHNELSDPGLLARPASLLEPFICEQSLPDDVLRSLTRSLSPLRIQGLDPANGIFSLNNRFGLTDSSCFGVEWSLIRDGETIKSETLSDFSLPAGESRTVRLDYGQADLTKDSDYLLRWQVVSRQGCPFWYKAGSQVDQREFILKTKQPRPRRTIERGGRLRLESDRHHLIVAGPRFWFVFNKISASLESWRSGDREWLAARRFTKMKGDGGPAPVAAGLSCSLDRPPEPGEERDRALWRRFGYESLLTSMRSLDSGCDAKTALIEAVFNLGAAGQKPAFAVTVRYEVNLAGRLRIFASLQALSSKALAPPCFSVCFNPSRIVEQLSWFGYGPEPSLSRLAPASELSAFHAEHLRYLCRPEAGAGSFRQVRNLYIRNPEGPGLLVESDRLFAFAVYQGARQVPKNAFGDLDRLEDCVIQIFQQDSLAARPLKEPLKLLFDFTPVI